MSIMLSRKCTAVRMVFLSLSQSNLLFLNMLFRFMLPRTHDSLGSSGASP